MTDPWYERWFGEEYLELYPHRDEWEAEAGVELLLRNVRLDPGARVLDLACGAGRHLHHLRARKLAAVGLDLSAPLLQRARDRAPVARGDMRRLPFGSERFDAVTSYFTSFGYFPDETDDARVLREVARVLKPGGRYLLDFLNADRVRRELSPRDTGTVGGRRVEIERRLLEEGRYVEKSIRLETPGKESAGEVFRERVRLYEPDALEALLEAHGLRPERRFGDYDGGGFRKQAPRVIVLARTE